MNSVAEMQSYNHNTGSVLETGGSSDGELCLKLSLKFFFLFIF